MDNWRLYLILVGCLVLGCVSASSIECNGIEEPNKLILCYANGSISLPTHVDECRCSHLVVPFAVNTLINASITLDEELVAFLKASGSRNGGRLRRVLSLTMSTGDFAPISSAQSIATSLAGMIDDLLIEGVEIHWQQPSIDENSKKDKANLVLFMKELHAVLQEKIIVTSNPDATSDMNSTSAGENGAIEATRPLILLRLPTAPEFLVKAFDLKPLARTVDLFVVATHDMADANNVTYHHSRLMGLSDILNTDSVLDLVASLGVSSDRVVAAIPTFAVQFRLRDVHQNLPGSPIVGDPLRINKEQLCSLLSKGNWTVERDDDLTGTYAYSEEGDWIAFDDEIAAQIKAKYFLLRDVAGVAMMPANMDDKLTHGCNANVTEPSIVQIYYEQFHYQESGERTRRQLATSLQEDVSSTAAALSSPLYNERVKASPYRIVRIVSRSGESSVIRQPLESNLQCSRQGYYRHPEDCGRFYRCVKFDQYVDDFTVFEYDCPEGLVFDERYEVCTWPSQAAPCGGSSEIRPVPMNKFVCPGEGYFADPENCRWFFACRDYAKDGSPFTQYEFRCPFGLLFDEQNLICNWPWLVPQCSGTGTVGAIGSTSNIDVVKSKPQLEKKQPAGIAIGSPGYLSGKLVTGEGLYKDPRPTQYMEIVASTGCIDCQSAGLVVRDPSDDTYPGSPNAKQTKFVLAIPAATIADQTTPVRIIVASPASSELQYPVSTTPLSYVQKYPSATTPVYDTAYGLSSRGPSGSHGSPANQRTSQSTGSSQTSASSDMFVPNSPGYRGNEQTSGYPRGPTSVSASATAELQGSYGKGVLDIYRSETRSKDNALPSAYSDPSSKYTAPIQGSGVSSPQTQHATVGYNTGAGLTGASSYPVQTGKDGVEGTEGSPVYPSGLGSEGARGQYDGYSDVSGVGHVGLVKTAGSTSSYQATAHEASKDNSRYSEYPDGAPVYQAPTTGASYLSYTPEKSQYQAPVLDQKRPYSTYSVPVSTANLSGNFNEAPASVIKTVVGAYKDSASHYEAPAPAYEASSPTYKATVPVYQPTVSAYEVAAPSYEISTPAYKAPSSAFKTPAPVYQAPAPVYEAGVRVQETGAAVEKTSIQSYPATSTMPPGQVYEAADPSYKPLVSGHKTTASIHKTSFPIYEESSSVYKASVTVDKVSPPVYIGPTTTYTAPFTGTDTSTTVVHDEKTFVDKATPSTYETPAATVKADTRSPYSVAAPIYKESTSAELNKPYGSPTTRPSGPSAYDFHEADAKNQNTYSSTLTVPYIQGEETGDGQRPSYPANSVAKDHANGYDHKQNSAAVPVHGYKEPTGGQTVSGAGVGAQQGKTNEATLSPSSYTSKAVPSKTQQVNRDYRIGDVKSGTRAGTSSYSSEVTSSVQQKGREKSQAILVKDTEWDIEDLFRRGSPSEKTTKAPSRRPDSSLTNVMRDAKQPMQAYQETGKVSGSRRTGSAGETRGTGGADGTSGTGGNGGARGSGGVDETRRVVIGSRTPGSGGYRAASGLRDMTHGAPAAVSATAYSAAGYSTARDGPNGGGVYGKSNQNTNSPASRYQDDDETSDQLGDHTFGLKEDTKTKNKYNASQLATSQSRPASARPKADADPNRRVSNGKISYGGSRVAHGNEYASSKQDVSDAIGRVRYKGSDRSHAEQRKAESITGVDSETRQSKSDAATSPPVSIYHDKVSTLPTKDEAYTPYGDKRVTVKVPSTNKAAILEKWTTASLSAINTKPNSVEVNRLAVGGESSLHTTPAKPQPSVKDLKLNNKQWIKNRVNAKPENQGLTAQSNVETSATTAIPSSSWKKNSNDGLGGITGTEYGHRYLEKITVAQATARNETLGSEVCVRAGLFRHPSDCQKFYECYWDRWIHQYTVHIFKCPVHLVYDDYITACNWPLDGPACVPHEAVKLYPQLPSAA